MGEMTGERRHLLDLSKGTAEQQHIRADLPFPLSFCLGSSHQTWMQYALSFSMLMLDKLFLETE